jgi:hypothetical protein
MIQRIQSLYLLLGAIALGTLFFFDSIWQSQAATTQPWFTPSLMALTIASIAVGGGAIFLFGARDRQRTVVIGAQMITVLLLVALYGGLFMSDGLNLRAGAGYDIPKIIALLLPVVAYGFFYLARRGIERDIKKVEDMNSFRLRD